MLESVSAMGDGVTHPEELLGDRVEPVLILLCAINAHSVPDSFSWSMHQAKEKSRSGGQEITRGLRDALGAHLHILILLILLYFLCSLWLRFVG